MYILVELGTKSRLRVKEEEAPVILIYIAVLEDQGGYSENNLPLYTWIEITMIPALKTTLPNLNYLDALCTRLTSSS